MRLNSEFNQKHTHTHNIVTLSFWIFPARDEWVPTCWKSDGLNRILRFAFCRSQCFWRTQNTNLYRIKSAQVSTTPEMFAHRILLGVAHFDPHDVIQQPIDGLIFVEHQHELHNEGQVQRLKHLTCQNTGPRHQGDCTENKLVPVECLTSVSHHSCRWLISEVKGHRENNKLFQCFCKRFKSHFLMF